MTTLDLRVDELHAGYGSIMICRGINLTVPAGSVVALLGPNGAGKSTLVKAIAGLLSSTGSICLRDRELGGTSPAARARNGLTTVTDDRALFRELTVDQNLQLGASVGRRSDREAPDLKALFPAIADRGATKAGLLSGGEQQMLAIAKALAGRPEVLVLDEPSQGLAPAVVAEVGEALQTLKRQRVSALVAEQNLDLVSGLADHYAVLAGGRVADAGPIDKLDRDDLAAHFLSEEISSP